MKLLEVLTHPKMFPYRRKSGKTTYYYARYPNGDFFQSSGNNKQIFYIRREALIQNIRYHASNLYKIMGHDIEDISSEEDTFNKLMENLMIYSVS